MPCRPPSTPSIYAQHRRALRHPAPPDQRRRADRRHRLPGRHRSRHGHRPVRAGPVPGSRATADQGLHRPQEALHDYGEQLDALHAQKGHVVGVPTGFIDLDQLLGGLRKSDLIILAARPSAGKTALAYGHCPQRCQGRRACRHLLPGNVGRSACAAPAGHGGAHRFAPAGHRLLRRGRLADDHPGHGRPVRTAHLHR